MSNLQETLEQRFDLTTEDGRCEVQDIANYGIQGGFGDFIYTTELVEFYEEHETELLEFLEDMDLSLEQMAVDAQSLSDIQTQVVWVVVECWCAHQSDRIDCGEFEPVAA